MKSSLFCSRKRSVTSGPNWQLTPRLLIDRPFCMRRTERERQVVKLILNPRYKWTQYCCDINQQTLWPNEVLVGGNWPGAVDLTRGGHTWDLWKRKVFKCFHFPFQRWFLRVSYILMVHLESDTTWVWRLSVPVNLPEVLQCDTIFTEQSAVHHLR